MPLTPVKRFLLFAAIAFFPPVAGFFMWTIAEPGMQNYDELSPVLIFLFLTAVIPSAVFNFATRASAARDSILLIRSSLMHLLVILCFLIWIVFRDGADLMLLAVLATYAVPLCLATWPVHQLLKKREKEEGTDVISTIGADLPS